MNAEVWYQTSIDQQTTKVQGAIGCWKGSHRHMCRALQNMLLDNTNDIDNDLMEHIETIHQAMRPIPLGTILWHGSNLEFSYNRHKWLSTTLSFDNAYRFVSKGCNENPHFFIQLIVRTENVMGIPCKDDDASGF
jgi:hypothetical protein